MLRWAALLLLAASGANACRMTPTGQANVVRQSVAERPSANPEALTQAWYSDLSDRYDHGILGDAREPTVLHAMSANTSAQCGLSLGAGAGHVFEDTAPRLVDVTGDGAPEVIAVRTDLEQGAQLVVYAPSGDGRTLRAIASTPYIGQRHRWLAPIGAADLDGDGHIEVAFVDRPHLAKILRVWRYRDGDFREVAAAEGFANHRIGEADIAGGVRDCGQGPEMIVASADWSRLLAVRFDGAFRVRDLGRDTSRPAFARAMGCGAG